MILGEEDGFSMEKTQKKLKAVVFETVASYSRLTENINPAVFYFLVFVETLQILWFSIHNELQFLGETVMLS